VAQITSGERTLRALSIQSVDHVRCCFMSFSALRKRHDEDRYEVAKAERAMDLDAMLFTPLAGGWGVGMDMANWLCGMQNLMMEQPASVEELLEVVHARNMQRMEVALSAPVDLYIRRAWYEGYHSVTPRFYREVILPRLKVEVDLAHERGAKFEYICSSGIKPMLDDYPEAGMDVLIGIDPIQGAYTDMPLLRQKRGSQVCLWGGVSGAVTMEMGTEEEVRAAVRHAIQTLGRVGFILSPVDNIIVDAPRTWQNVDVFIDEWLAQGHVIP
jgi:uroporphyrinogen-III decarboxylase